MERLKALREQRGLSRETLAVGADMSPVTLWRYETGKRSPTVDQLEKLAEVMDVEVGDILPKAQAPLWPGDGRRDYVPWLEFVNSYADRWEEKIAQEALDLGAVYEFIAIVEDLAPVLSRLGLQEKREQPQEYIPTFGPVMGEAIGRLMDLLDPLIKAGVKQFEETDLARLRRSREEMTRNQTYAANG